jgi:hypothetical protein
LGVFDQAGTNVIEVERNGEVYKIRLSEACAAPPEVVYGLLSDLSTHMEWGGSWHPTRTQRLLSMESPKGPATVGVEFASTGSAGGGFWYDRSRVTAATSPTVFEFETHGQLRDGHGEERMLLRAVHRYGLSAEHGGTRLTYSCTATLELRGTGGDHHPRLPAVIFNLVVPSVIERGTRNLVRMAEERAGLDSLAGAPAAPVELLPEGA